jgi:hypothetical protein
MANIVANTKDGEHSIEFDYDFGDSLDQAVERFGAEIVWAHTLRSLTIAVQGAARGMMKSGKSREEILDAMSKWKPGEPRQVKSNDEKMAELVAKMTPAQLEALSAQLRSAQTATEAPAKKGKNKE